MGTVICKRILAFAYRCDLGGVLDSGDQGGGEVDPHKVHRFLAFLSFSEQYDSTMKEIGGGGGGGG